MCLHNGLLRFFCRRETTLKGTAGAKKEKWSWANSSAIFLYQLIAGSVFSIFPPWQYTVNLEGLYSWNVKIVRSGFDVTQENLKCRLILNYFILMVIENGTKCDINHSNQFSHFSRLILGYWLSCFLHLDEQKHTKWLQTGWCCITALLSPSVYESLMEWVTGVWLV